MRMREAGVAIGLGTMLMASVPVEAGERRERREEARKDDHRDRHNRHGRDRQRDDAVEISDTAAGVIAGALVIGGIAALFGARKARAPVAPEPQPVSFTADADPERVASACVTAAEAEGRRTFAIAQVGAVRAVEPAAEGFAVDGDLLLRGSWREAGERYPFRCTVDPQAVRSVTIEGLRLLPVVASN